MFKGDHPSVYVRVHVLYESICNEYDYCKEFNAQIICLQSFNIHGVGQSNDSCKSPLMCVVLHVCGEHNYTYIYTLILYYYYVVVSCSLCGRVGDRCMYLMMHGAGRRACF